MRVILFRHGPAAERDALRWPDDSLRPLTSRGAQLTREAVTGLARIEPHIDQVATSPFARARQTAQVVADVLRIGEIAELDALRPGGSVDEIILFLAARMPRRTIVLVGHEPDLGTLAGLLLFGAPMPLPLRKACACAIRFEDSPREGGGRLAWFLPPRVLRKDTKRRLHPAH